MNLTNAHRTILNHCFLFQSLSDDERQTIFQTLTADCFQKGEIIYSQHHFRHSLGILVEGAATVLKGNGTLLNLLEPGNCFGAAALFAPAEEYVTTVTARKVCRIVFLSSDKLTQLFEAHPNMALDYISFLSGRIQFLNRKIDSFTTPSAETAVWQWITFHADPTGIVRVDGGFARLAKELSIGRATLYRSLAQLEQEGRILKNGAEIRIMDQHKNYHII